MNTDPIADLLTRIRNALQAGHRYVEIPHSNMKERIVQVLKAEGYLQSYELKDDAAKKFKVLRLVLKYDQEGYPVIRKIDRVSRPGRRLYSKSIKIPRVLSGAGVAVMSTNKGVISDRQARRDGVGGEVLCFVE